MRWMPYIGFLGLAAVAACNGSRLSGGSRRAATGTCGNGIVEGTEACDLGEFNADSGACKTDCSLQRCGDGFVGPGEVCDDGNSVDEDGCTNACSLPVLCPNGRPDLGEECDDGDADDTNGCLTNCRLARCGDGVVRRDIDEPSDPRFELCDDGVHNSNFAVDACRADCRPAHCGDEVVDSGEACDDGAANSDTTPDACRSDCSLARCGDGVVDGGEDCDDGPANSDATPDACRSNCTLPRCGDEVTDSDEDCDAGGVDSVDCDEDCTVPRCGDGHTNFNAVPAEECDDAGESADCDADCTRRTCGDGTVNTTAGEACDVGTVVPNGQCTLDCDIVCETNYGDCNDAPGCETNLLSDGNNCGRCGHDCGGGACGLGVCQPVEIAELGTMHYLKLEGMQIYQDRVWNETDAGLASVPLDARGLTTPVVYSSVVPTLRGYSFVDSDIWFFSNLKLYSAPIADTGATPALLSDTVPWGPAMQVYGDSLYVLTSYDSPTKPRVVWAPLADPNSYATADLSFQGVPLYGLLVTGGEVYFASAGATSGELWRVNTDLSDPQPVLVGTRPDVGFYLAQSDAGLFWGVDGGVERVTKDPYACLPDPICAADTFVTTAGGSPPLDVDATHLYWADRAAHAIRRKDLASGQVDDLLIDSQHDPVDLVVGPDFICWLEWSSADSFYGDGTLWKLAK